MEWKKQSDVDDYNSENTGELFKLLGMYKERA